MRTTGVPDELTEAEVEGIPGLSLPLIEEDIAPLATAMRRLSATVEPLLSTSETRGHPGVPWVMMREVADEFRSRQPLSTTDHAT